MKKVYVLIEWHQGRAFVVTSSTDGKMILAKARKLARKAATKGLLIPDLPPKVRGDLDDDELRRRYYYCYEYKISVFDDITGRPFPTYFIRETSKWRWMDSGLSKAALLPHYR